MSGDPYPYGVPVYPTPACHTGNARLTYQFPYPPGVSSTAAPDFPFTERHLRGLIREIVREELRAAGVIKDCS